MPVYFARSGSSVKIGWAINADKRVASLRCGCPTEIVIVRTVDGPRHLEGDFHRLFRHRRIRGEWFIWGKDMLTAMPVPAPPRPVPLSKHTGSLSSSRRATIAKDEVRYAVGKFDSISHAARVLEMPRTVLTHWLQYGVPTYRKRDADRIIEVAANLPMKAA